MVFRVPTEEKCFFFDKKQDAALFMLQDSPLKWFRDAPIDQRDFDLIRSERVPWLDYSQQSYARKIVRFHRSNPSATSLTLNF